MKVSDWKLLEPFTKEMNAGINSRVKLLHTSHICKCYYVSFGNEDNKYGQSMVVKVYLQKDRLATIREVKNLRWAEEVQKRIPDYAVQIPEVQWINISSGIIATRWIPGANLDTILCNASRIWSLHKSGIWNKKIIKLFEWLVSFSRISNDLSYFIQKGIQEDTDWYEWTTWLAEANHFKKEWRGWVIPALQKLRHNVDQKEFKRILQHGDFSPHNIRLDLEGNMYVMDWEDLEIGDWLSPAYRFFYALRISALSPLAKLGYYKSIYEIIEEFIKTHQPDEEIRRYYKARAVLQNIKFLCREPARSPKKYNIKRFLIKELNFQLIGDSTF